jgi:hypothetical protein
VTERLISKPPSAYFDGKHTSRNSRCYCSWRTADSSSRGLYKPFKAAEEKKFRRLGENGSQLFCGKVVFLACAWRSDRHLCVTGATFITEEKHPTWLYRITITARRNESSKLIGMKRSSEASLNIQSSLLNEISRALDRRRTS